MRPRGLPFFLALVLATVLAGGSYAAEVKPEWLPVTPEELALKDEPASPGEHAIYLYREHHLDDKNSFSTHYYRIKIFTEEGRRHADIEIPYWKDRLRIEDLHGRTIQADGSVVNFTGSVFDKVVARTRGVQILSKTFTLPDARAGSVVEYRYKTRWSSSFNAPLRWDIQESLFTRKGRFSLRPADATYLSLGWVAHGLKGDLIRRQTGGEVNLELTNIAGLPEEDFMPPDEIVRSRVTFYYRSPTSYSFWGDIRDYLLNQTDKFIGKPKDIDRFLRAATTPEDSAETKLRKLYARVQQIRNLEFDLAARQSDEKWKENKSAADVLERNYGKGWDLNLTFVALARAAGLEASLLLLAQRDRMLFDRNLLSAGQLTANIVEVRLDSKPLYLDPATARCPFGLVPWEETGTGGIRLSKGDLFVSIPSNSSGAAILERKGSLTLESDGTVHGTLLVTFGGQEALSRRLEAIRTDEAGWRKNRESEAKSWVPSGATLELRNHTGLEKPDEPLRLEFSLRIPGVGSPTGRRLLLPAGVLQAGRRNPFEHTRRIHPVYFPHAYQEQDEIELHLPPGYTVESLPQAKSQPVPFGDYESSLRHEGGVLREERRFSMQGNYFTVDHYAELKKFFEQVRSADEQQVVLQSTAPAR